MGNNAPLIHGFGDIGVGAVLISHDTAVTEGLFQQVVLRIIIIDGLQTATIGDGFAACRAELGAVAQDAFQGFAIDVLADDIAALVIPGFSGATAGMAHDGIVFFFDLVVVVAVLVTNEFFIEYAGDIAGVIVANAGAVVFGIGIAGHAQFIATAAITV